jgi:hypothetical protein
MDKICTEDTAVNPISRYARYKADAERTGVNEENTATLRCATAFGVSPRMRFDLMPNRFVLDATRDDNVVVYQASARRTLILVSDMARAPALAVDPILPAGVYNV